jgi:hypothetical protein
MREFCAVSERHDEALWREDAFHARTAQSMRGGRLDDITFYPRPGREPSGLLGPDGKPVQSDGPIGIPFDRAIAMIG